MSKLVRMLLPFAVLAAGLPAGALVRLGSVRFRPPAENVAVAFSPDGKLLAAGSWHDRGVRLWDAATGKEVRRWEVGQPVYAVAYAPDGKTVAAASVRVHVW